MLPIGIDENNDLVYEEDVEPYVVRTTDRTNFKDCRRKWNYTSKQRQNLEPIQMNKNLGFGISMHKGLEYFYEPALFGSEVARDACIAGFLGEEKRQREEEEAASYYGLAPHRQEMYEERKELGVGMLKGYFDYAYTEDAKESWQPVAVELKFQIPVPNDNAGGATLAPMVTWLDGRPVVYQVRLDMVAVNGDGELWVWDHKTAANVTGSLDFLDLDTQLSSYILALQSLLNGPVEYVPEVLKPYHGQKVHGLQYNELAKSVPHPPKQNKNGALSQDKRQNTTYELYVAELDRLGLDTGPYQGMLDYLSAQPETRFRRTPVSRSVDQLRLQLQYIIGEARDMTNMPSVYPNPNKFRCNGCDFTLPCRIANETGDEQFVLDDTTLFRQRPDALEETLDA
jgi:CRISPR/Cas system-associated exonuclease Cas4 (RecB family)